MQARGFNLRLAIAVAVLAWSAGTVFASRMPAGLADVLRCLLPGIVVAWIAGRLRFALPAQGRVARIGANLLLLSALAFAAQAPFAIDLEDPDAGANRARALAWALWWIAFAPGALLYGIPRGRAWFAASLVAVALACVPALLSLPAGALPLAQSVAVLGWFAWWFAAAGQPALSRAGA